MRYVLLTPGPVSLSSKVRKAAVGEDLCHREAEYFLLQERVREGLLDVYGCDPAQWNVVLLGGSGTTAIEAMIASMLPRDAKLLVIQNGVYGERISRIAEIHGISFETVGHEWTDAIDHQRVEEALARGGFSHLAAVHHETTTGRLNDVRRLAALCGQYGAELLLDAVSSFGAEDLPFDSDVLTACAATANKCLHGISGLCFVVCRRAAMAQSADPPRSLSLHLPLWADKQDRQTTPFTPPVNAVQALNAALQDLKHLGGWRGRHASYSQLGGQVRRELERLGIQPLLPESASSCVLTAYRLPPERSYDAVHRGLKQRGFVIYAGQGSLAGDMFRISTMGDISRYDMERLLAALQAVFSA